MKKIVALAIILTSFSVFAESPTTDPKAVGAPANPVASTAIPVFEGERLQLKNYIEDLFQESKKVNSTNKAEKKKSREKLTAVLAWDEVAKSCLGSPKWNSVPEAQRTQFRDLLKDVILKTAFTRLDKFWSSLTYNFEKIEIKKDAAVVVVKFMDKAEGFELEYAFHRRSGKWVMHDLAVDGTRYSTSIREDQIEPFLQQNSFAKLLDKLKKRQQELS